MATTGGDDQEASLRAVLGRRARLRRSCSVKPGKENGLDTCESGSAPHVLDVGFQRLPPTPNRVVDVPITDFWAYMLVLDFQVDQGRMALQHGSVPL